MAADHDTTDALLGRAERGDQSAIGQLFDRHRPLLRRLIARKLHRRLAQRIDPSDVVQEALADAGRRLPEYLGKRPVGFLPWLRRLAEQRLVWCQRLHLGASRRSVAREAPNATESAGPLLDGLIASSTSPSGIAVRNEESERVRAAVASLAQIDRDILILRYDEQLAFAEIAARLGIGVGAANMRHLRALERLRAALEDTNPHQASS